MGLIHHVYVGGVKAATASRAELARMIVEECLDRRGKPGRTKLLFDTNGHGVSLAARDPDYRSAIASADLVHADGGWIVLASRYLSGERIAERSATTDLLHDLAKAGVGKGLRHYLLGGTEEVNAECARRLVELYPGIVIAGRRNGYFDPEDEADVIGAIDEAQADVLWVGLGKPKEQSFAVRHRDEIAAAWTITSGGCFNYVSGDYRRAPHWMQRANLEWLFRAATTPKLLWRYAMTTPHALWLALTKIDRRVEKGP
jgi:exopolysaccharide biosynthesis WecB/TagA/CpsF family protein